MDRADPSPSNRLKQDKYYFAKQIAKCDSPNGTELSRLHHRWSERRTHFWRKGSGFMFSTVTNIPKTHV